MQIVTGWNLLSPPKQQPYLITSENESIPVSGCCLEAVVQIKDRQYVVFTTENSPYEEVLYIELFDSQQQKIDQINIQQGYASGIFSDLSLVSDDSLEFVFLEGNTFRLDVHFPPKFKLTRLLPSGVISAPGRSTKEYLSVKIITQ